MLAAPPDFGRLGHAAQVVSSPMPASPSSLALEHLTALHGELAALQRKHQASSIEREELTRALSHVEGLGSQVERLHSQAIDWQQQIDALLAVELAEPEAPNKREAELKEQLSAAEATAAGAQAEAATARAEAATALAEAAAARVEALAANTRADEWKRVAADEARAGDAAREAEAIARAAEASAREVVARLEAAAALRPSSDASVQCGLARRLRDSSAQVGRPPAASVAVVTQTVPTAAVAASSQTTGTAVTEAGVQTTVATLISTDVQVGCSLARLADTATQATVEVRSTASEVQGIE